MMIERSEENEEWVSGDDVYVVVAPSIRVIPIRPLKIETEYEYSGGHE
jgi:hypothetical protein